MEKFRWMMILRSAAEKLRQHAILLIVFSLLGLSVYFALDDSLKQTPQIIIPSVLLGAIVVYALISNQRYAVVVVLPIIIVIMMCAAFASRKLIYNIGYDTWMHLSLIQRGVEKGLFPGNPYYADLATPPHYSLIDIIHSAWSFITRIRPHILWGLASPFFLATIASATFAWVKELTQDAKIGLLAMVLGLSTVSITWRRINFLCFGASILFSQLEKSRGTQCYFIGCVLWILYNDSSFHRNYLPSLTTFLRCAKIYCLHCRQTFIATIYLRCPTFLHPRRFYRG